MDTSSIGEYLKRLRLRANYTQSEVGKHISVTDKAISRWESGQGMPELGNLVVIADLFGVKVDDILHCNEKVFESGEKKDGGNAESAAENTVFKSVSADSQTSQNAMSGEKAANIQSAAASGRTLELAKDAPAKESPKRISAFDKYQAVIFAAILTMGIFLAVYIPYLEDFGPHLRETTTPIIIFIFLAFLYVALPFVSKFFPKKVGLICKITLSALCAVTALVLSILLVFFKGAEYGDYGNYLSAGTGAIGAAVFFLLFTSSLLYVLTEFFENDFIQMILRIACAVIGGVMIILGIVGTVKLGREDFFELVRGFPDAFISLCSIVFGLISIAFALRELKIIGMGVTTTVLLFLPSLLFIIGCFNSMDLFETYFRTNAYNHLLLLAISSLAPAVQSIGFLLEKTKHARNARLITTVIAFLLLIPCIYYTLDIFALNVYLKAVNFNTAVFLRIAVIIAAIANYAVLFIPERKGEKAL